MKGMRALDISGSGRIDETKFKRLCNPLVISAAKLKLKVDGLWVKIPKDDRRILCWEAGREFSSVM